MKNFLLTLFLVLASAAGIQAQTFEWGTASWNIADGTEFDGIDEFSQKGLVLSFTNPADYALTFLNIIAVDYDLYIDGSTEAVNGFATGHGSTDVSFRLDAFAEGHQYRLVATKATLVQAGSSACTAFRMLLPDTCFSSSRVKEEVEPVKVDDL